VKRLGLALSLVLAACSATPPSSPPPVEIAPVPAPSASAPPPSDPVSEARARVASMLARVGRTRGLPVKREVPSRVLDREKILAKIRAKVEKELPPDVVEHEGEVLAALGLVPPRYDFVEGSLKLIQGRIAGFYEPADGTMYLVDDLAEDEATETLAHELGHALQDQSFALGPLLDFAPGQGDRTAAVHAVAEGDAMAIMFAVTLGPDRDVPVDLLRAGLSQSNAASSTAATTPHILQESLVAPYGDGFAFVQARRAQRGWPSVDEAWRALPETTEQLLHEDKYAAREPPIAVATPAFGALGAGFRAATTDVMGEQGLRLLLAEWTRPEVAVEAAAGWGGDRYVVARRDDGPGKHTIAVAWRVEMDTDADAEELAAAIAARFGRRCQERPVLGPIAWTRAGRRLALVAGPYTRAGGDPQSAGNCALSARWLREVLP
jgi:hypothetical protein